jgi:eukaryotic-like serine/threonine-protein kinase
LIDKSGMEDTAENDKHVKKYWAFVSYSSKDKKWGKWLHNRLESFPIPKEFQGTELFDGAVLGKDLKPCFRDRDELSGSADLGPAIFKALNSTRYLIVLCSPNSAKSEWVNKEIEDFKEIGGEKRILALILDGEPNSDGDTECFPPALRYPAEPLAGDLRKEGDGKERGFLQSNFGNRPA